MTNEFKNLLYGEIRMKHATTTAAGFKFYCNCVCWPRNDVDADGGLNDLIAASEPITRATFLKHVDRSDLRNLERNLQYASHPSQGLTMAADWSVSYFRSKLHGRTVYGFDWSAIEYVFVPENFNHQESE